MEERSDKAGAHRFSSHDLKIVELLGLVRRLRDGMNAWASDEDGVHPDAWEAYADAFVALGESRPCPDCGRHPCTEHDQSQRAEATSREQRAIEADLASDGYDAAGRPLASKEA